MPYDLRLTLMPYALSLPHKIDIHTHIMPEKIPNWFEKFGYGEFIHLEHHKPCCAKMMKGDKFFREIESNCWEPKDRIIEMDSTDVSIQVLSTIPVLFNYWAKPAHGLETSRFFNDHIAGCVNLYPDKFIGSPFMERAQEIFQAIQQNKTNYNKLTEIKESAELELKFN